MAVECSHFLVKFKKGLAWKWPRRNLTGASRPLPPMMLPTLLDIHGRVNPRRRVNLAGFIEPVPGFSFPHLNRISH
jgi:hypothetical protein